MGGGIQRRLYCDLQSVLDESRLAEVFGDSLGAREIPQLLHTGFDERQLLGNQGAIGRDATPERYSRR